MAEQLQERRIIGIIAKEICGLKTDYKIQIAEVYYHREKARITFRKDLVIFDVGMDSIHAETIIDFPAAPFSSSKQK
jgi:hypothetical protein